LSNGKSVTRFPIEGGRAKFSTIKLESKASNGKLRLSTRRGKQFNSMVHQKRDPLTGAQREDILMSQQDADRIGLSTGDPVIVRSSAGEMRGRCRIAPIARGNVQAHWPEANPLIERGVFDSECGIPDFNTEVEIERAG
jgi:anaerobic selenocysteine-containing dehydrogenase